MKSLKIVGVVAVSVMVVTMAMCCAYKRISSEVVKLHTYDDRVSYLQGMELSVDGLSETAKEVYIPTNFNAIYTEYSAQQMAKGLPSLQAFQGDLATVYAYTLSDGETIQLLLCDDILLGMALI
jgi:hypothetical protein